MSCITAILKAKGDKEFLACPNHAIEDGGIYKGYEWLVTLTNMGHRCGYVALPEDHPLNKYNLVNEEAPEGALSCHGGITFHATGQHITNSVLGEHHCSDKWIGFDAAHAWDKRDYELAKKVFAEFPDVLKHLEFMENLESTHGWREGEEQIRTKQYMARECCNLIDQILAILH